MVAALVLTIWWGTGSTLELALQANNRANAIHTSHLDVGRYSGSCYCQWTIHPPWESIHSSDLRSPSIRWVGVSQGGWGTGSKKNLGQAVKKCVFVSVCLFIAVWEDDVMHCRYQYLRKGILHSVTTGEGLAYWMP